MNTFNLTNEDARLLLAEIDPDWREHYHDPQIALERCGLMEIELAAKFAGITLRKKT